MYLTTSVVHVRSTFSSFFFLLVRSQQNLYVILYLFLSNFPNNHYQIFSNHLHRYHFPLYYRYFLLFIIDLLNLSSLLLVNKLSPLVCEISSFSLLSILQFSLLLAAINTSLGMFFLAYNKRFSSSEIFENNFLLFIVSDCVVCSSLICALRNIYVSLLILSMCFITNRSADMGRRSNRNTYLIFQLIETAFH